MANDENQDETQTGEKSTSREEAPKEPSEVYYVHNVTRGRHNRTLRAGAPKHHGLKQYLGGGTYRSTRGRPIVLTREGVGRHIEELRQKIDAGIFELRTGDGRIVDIRTGNVAPRGASPALPRPVLDSIANDKQNVGQQMPQYVGGDVEGTPGEEPTLLKDAEDSEPTSPPPPEPVTEVSPEIAPPAPPPTDPEAPSGVSSDETLEDTTTEDTTYDELPDLVGGATEPTPEAAKRSSTKSEKKRNR